MTSIKVMMSQISAYSEAWRLLISVIGRATVVVSMLYQHACHDEGDRYTDSGGARALAACSVTRGRTRGQLNLSRYFARCPEDYAR